MEQKSYDLILMDIEMPEMDGLETTDEIRRRWGDDSVSIIAMTANAMRGDKDRYLAAGMNDYVSKPIRIKSLVQAIERCGTEATGDGASGSPAEAVHQAPSDASEDYLDQSALDNLMELIGGDQDALTELVESFLSEGPKLMKQLAAAADQGDADGVRRAAHTIKSSGNDFGATALAELSRDLEQRGKAGDVTDAVARASRIQLEYERTKTALERLLGA